MRTAMPSTAPLPRKTRRANAAVVTRRRTTSKWMPIWPTKGKCPETGALPEFNGSESQQQPTLVGSTSSICRSHVGNDENTTIPRTCALPRRLATY